jgi:Domain of unknown function (DUF4279)
VADPLRTSASFSLCGDALDPDAITAVTGLEPTDSHRKGDTHGTPPRRVGSYRSGYWSIDSDLDDLDSLESHIESLLVKLEPVTAALRSVCATWQLAAKFSCAHWTADFESGFELSAQTLGRMSALGAGFWAYVYSQRQ